MSEIWDNFEISQVVFTPNIMLLFVYTTTPPWVRTFFLKSLEMEFFSQTYNIVRLSALRDKFSVQDIFSPGISLQEYFFSQISVQDIFFWNHPYTPPNLPCKSQIFGPLGNHHCWEHREWLVVNITWQLIDSLHPNLANGNCLWLDWSK